MRFLASQFVRRDDLECVGPKRCKQAVEVTCRDCGLTREPEDIDLPGACPDCGSWDYIRERCPECPHLRLDEALASSVGQTVLRGAEILAALIAGFRVDLADVTCEEYRAVQALRLERDKYQTEKSEKRWPDSSPGFAKPDSTYRDTSHKRC